MSARNNVVSELTNTRWSASPHPQTLHYTALSLCHSTAEYACPVWELSTHAKKLDPALKSSCRLVTGCLKTTSTNSLYLLVGIAPPNIRRAGASMKEHKRQLTDERHSTFGQTPFLSCLNLRKSFLNCATSRGWHYNK